MTEHRYRNPWAKPSEPQEYIRHVEPFNHAGCQIYHVHPDQWDVVKSGVCIMQRSGRSGSIQCAEVVQDIEAPTFEDVRERMLEKYGYL